MKTLIASLILVTWLANPANAQSKKMHHKSMASCPAKTCTDHSYDQAYTAPQTHWKSHNNNAAMKNCPAATCTDHSLDVAYSATHNLAPAGREEVIKEPRLPRDTWTAMTGSENSYSMQEFTYYGRGVTGINRPSAYEGDDAPTYDGFQKNAYRNMRANNTSERLPSNSGW